MHVDCICIFVLATCISKTEVGKEKLRYPNNFSLYNLLNDRQANLIEILC